MYQLVYVSSMRADFSEDDLKDILSQARKANKSLGISGILVCLGDCFLQVLEGEPECVRELYAKIENDPRHSGVKVLAESDVAERTFPDWSMGFRMAGSDDLYMAGFLALARRALEGRSSRTDAIILQNIIKTFYRPDNAPEADIERDPVLNVA